jgi:predicted amidophosphoribosyltransferase
VIAPEKLEQQRAGLHLVEQAEGRCPTCGRRTRDVKGRCASCRRSLPNLTRLTVEQVTGLIEQCRAELKRRRDEIDAAMEGGK